MNKYERVKGGEKNAKSGKRWERWELEKVYDLYIDLKGEGIHENNEFIHRLSKDLGRTVRSIEAQLLMYRNLQKKGEYGFGNMNKLIIDIWNERQQILGSMKGDENETLLPNWRSESIGAIRRPFDASTGRPAKSERFPSLIGNKLKKLISEDGTVAKALFLVGGPGNGKTDTLELIVELLDEKFGYKGQLASSVRKAFTNYSYKEVISLDSLEYGEIPEKEYLEIIQDASDSDGKLGADEAFKSSINNLLKSDYKGILLCCVNRGILDELRRSLESKSEEYSFIDKLTQAVGPLGAVRNIHCWPLDKDKEVYAWPMDVDSLLLPFESHEKEREVQNITFDYIIREALRQCQSNKKRTRGSIQENLRAFKNPDYADGLRQILLAMEVCNSYRFTFRDAFSLAAHLLDNTGSPYTIKEHEENCFIKRFDRLHEEWSNLYYNNIFKTPVFEIDSEFIGEVEKMKANQHWQTDRYNFIEAIKIISSKNENEMLGGSAISRLINQPGMQELDPGKSSYNYQVNDELGFKQIEQSFSKGIQNGLRLIKRFLSEIEIEYIEALSKIEEKSLNMLSVKKNYTVICRKCRNILRRYAAIISKRALGAKYGITPAKRYLTAFLDTCESSKEVRKFIKYYLQPMLFDSHRRLNISFKTTIGQINQHVPYDVRMKVYFRDSLNALPKYSGAPNWSFFAVGIDAKNSALLSINYENYKSYYQVSEEKINLGCIDHEFQVGLDRFITSISSSYIRDFEHFHNEDARIEIENLGHLTLNDEERGRFDFRKETKE